MSKDEVNKYDIIIEALEAARDTIERLQKENEVLEARVEKLRETLTIAEKTIYDSTEMFAHYDDCVALVTDEDEPDYECTCGRDKMILRTIDARFLIKDALKEDEG